MKGDTGNTGPQGATGATGARGPAGPVSVSVVTAVGANSGGVQSATATCGAGQVAVGGGGSDSNAVRVLTASFPVGSPTPTGWTVTTKETNGTQVGQPTAYVLCATPGS